MYTKTKKKISFSGVPFYNNEDENQFRDSLFEALGAKTARRGR